MASADSGEDARRVNGMDGNTSQSTGNKNFVRNRTRTKATILYVTTTVVGAVADFYRIFSSIEYSVVISFTGLS